MNSEDYCESCKAIVRNQPSARPAYLKHTQTIITNTAQEVHYRCPDCKAEFIRQKPDGKDATWKAK